MKKILLGAILLSLCGSALANEAINLACDSGYSAHAESKDNVYNVYIEHNGVKINEGLLNPPTNDVYGGTQFLVKPVNNAEQGRDYLINSIDVWAKGSPTLAVSYSEHFQTKGDTRIKCRMDK